MSAPEIKGRIFNIMRFSTHDGPGIRTTVFLKGCPLACWWCHNPENWGHVPAVVYIKDRCTGCGACVAACPHQALSLTAEGVLDDPGRCRGCGACVAACPAEARESTGRTIGVDELLQTVERDTPFYDQSGGGVTFSGGEPLAQPEFLMAALASCGRAGIHRAVDTSGYAEADVVRRAARLADLFLYDLKVMDPEAHRRCTGVDNARILGNLRFLSEAGAEVVVRMPLVPGVNDDPANIAATGEFLAGLPRRHPVDLLPYHDTARAKYTRLGLHRSGIAPAPLAAERLAAIQSELSRYGISTHVGG
jgi:pyruvate formate lyase activating enzyme